ncbi:MAG: hypothetical protein PHW08_13295, partial [Kiritimatiellae bacterium]|nr:hypothetical protein [Kiritimatiellia bacterium]
TTQEVLQSREFQSVVDDYRETWLWFFYVKQTPAYEIQLEQVLSAIERSGDLAAFKRVGRIRKWLSPNFKAAYSNSL